MVLSLFNKNKKAQGWSLDLVVGITIFLAGIIILYVYVVNYSSQSQKTLDELNYEGNLAAQLILSPDDFGILTNDRVNQTKLDQYYFNYSMKKSSLGIDHDFYFVMNNLEANGTVVNYIGKTNTTTTISNLIKVTRITIYKQKPTKFELYVWS
jgi:hypothetical protein